MEVESKLYKGLLFVCSLSLTRPDVELNIVSEFVPNYDGVLSLVVGCFLLTPRTKFVQVKPGRERVYKKKIKSQLVWIKDASAVPKSVNSHSTMSLV